MSGDVFADLRGAPVLVTGGLGFIGAHVCTYLVRHLGCQVTAIDDLSNSCAGVVRHLPELDVVVGDVRDAAVVEPLLRAHPWVLHLACRTILTCADDPDSDLSVNGLSTLRLLEFLRRERPTGFKRFLYASSTSIYGNCRHIPADELDPPNILNHYAATKLLGEHYTTLYYMAYGVPTACVRYSNVYGPGQTTSNPYCGVIGKFFDAADAGLPLTVHGDGEQTRDYTYVDDAIEGTLRALAAPQAVGDVFNIGTGVETSVNTLAQEIRAVTGNRARIEYVDRRDIDNIRRRALSPEKIRVRLGWQPQIRLREGLHRMAEARSRDQTALSPADGLRLGAAPIASARAGGLRDAG
jgi:UDP-glucose 4-epimerase